MKTIPCSAFALLLAGLSLSHAQDGSTRTIATISTQSPSFSDPVLNGSGVVSFTLYNYDIAGDDAIYKTTGTGLVVIASTLQTAPGLGANIANISAPILNENGTVAFSGSTAGGSTGIYTGSGGALTTIATTLQAAPGLTASISSFSTNIALSDSGSVAFNATTTTTSGSVTGEYGGSGGTLTAIATTLQTAPGTGAVFGTISAPVLNNTGSAAFQEQNGSAYGIYAAFGNTLTTVATTLQTAPEIGGTFTFFSLNPALNDNGTVAFLGVAGTARGIFARSGGVLTAIASTARQAPGFAGNFTTFSDPALSNSGIAAFRGVVSGGQGIYTGTGGALQTIAITGQAAPGVGGTFSGFGKPTVNDLGTTAFLGNVAGGSGSSGIYLGDGQQLITVAFLGQSLAGSTISSIIFTGGSDRGGNTQLNNNGQVAYRAQLTNGASAIQLFTPTLHFRSGTSGAWTTRSNWTLGLSPAAVHDVVLDPATALTITGPMLPTTIKSLAINGSGANVAELTMQNTGTITAAGGASTGVSGKLSGSGKLVANLSSAGTIAPGLAASAGAINVTGNVTLLGTAHLAFDLGGLTRKTNYDFFGVSGHLTLGGSLDVSLLGGFAPQAGNTFDLFDSGFTPTGSFAAIHLPVLTGGLTWNTTLLPTTGVISVAGLTVNPTTYTLAASASAATIHAGGSSTITATITNTGTAGTDTLNFSSLNVAASPAGGTVTNVTLNISNPTLANNFAAQSGTATFSSTTGGTYTLTPTVTSALNGTLGTAAAIGGVTATSVTVFSGSAKWNAPATASWGAGASTNWTDTAAASVHAAPGTFVGFAASDTAVFDATSGALVNLDGAAPSLAALSFTGGSHTIAPGTGGTVTLNNGASPATVTSSAGSHSITAPVQLGSNATTTVTNAADTLTLSGGLTGAGKTLTKTGAGKLVLSGAQNYATLNANGGLTDITGSFTGGTATVHANAAVKFEASQTLAALTIADGVEVTFGSTGGAAFDDPSFKTDAALIPEPGSASLLLLGALGFPRRRRAVR